MLLERSAKMAQMIPNDVSDMDFHGSVGEEKLYNSLKTLSDDYTVFHSVQWQKRLRSGNISWGESDFTIFHPKRGIIVVEVKSGGVTYNNGRWTQTNTITKQEYKMKDPLIQAGRSKFTFIDILSSPDGNENSYWVEAAVCFPSVEKHDFDGGLPPAYSPEIIITSEDLNNIEKSINRIFDYYGMVKQNYYTEENALRVKDILSPKFDAIPSLSNTAKEQDVYFNRMTLEQSYLLDYLEEQPFAAIQGGAGTGKTMLALEKAKRLSIGEPVLFLCYNRLLLDYLKTYLSNNLANVDFFNLPSLSCKMLDRADAIDNDSITKCLNSFDSLGWNYKHIIIDEAQDFLSEHIKLLLTIGEITAGSVYAFYDKNQLVQQRQEIDWVKKFECKLVLSSNCRNTKNIAQTSCRPIGIENIKMRREIMGEKPLLHLENSPLNALKRLSKLILYYTDNGFLKKDIVILTAKTEETSILCGKSSIGSYRLDNVPNGSGVLFTSSRKFKGLEASVVIMVDVDAHVFETEESCRVFYVGTSRAKHFLNVISIANEDELHYLAEVLCGQKQKNAKLSIASALKIKISDQRNTIY